MTEKFRLNAAYALLRAWAPENNRPPCEHAVPSFFWVHTGGSGEATAPDVIWGGCPIDCTATATETAAQTIQRLQRQVLALRVQIEQSTDAGFGDRVVVALERIAGNIRSGAIPGVR